MPKSDSRSRILYIYRILVEETDSEHQITIQQIIDRLEEIGITAYRKTIQSDIEQLIEFGVDIICIRSSQNRYYINSNVFTLSELKLLVDAVEASHFITQSKSAELIGKLSDLTSNSNADKLSRHIYLSKRMKSDNEEIYTDVVVTDNLCVPQPDGFSVAEYVSKVFRMYGDEPVVAVTLKCRNNVMKSVIDRFGFDVQTKPLNKEYFTAVVEVSQSQTFFGWVFQFGGDIQITKPAKVKRAFADMRKRIFCDDQKCTNIFCQVCVGVYVYQHRLFIFLHSIDGTSVR